ncbi:MEKHLA domain-containing protein [Myxococcus sp. K38C18041901]|uniref:MEKHLA domain-containing protein n=1 Tax=Myxococcus guangdongensis TaxID=2906760 RepID=UPI0020A79983|nr:MEKHLA domain-containing protein [Myxococcus guangdongensis]MCP3060359.1 MEKHLA domain-containing protein [Myxococcus guangdongensis]
MKTIHEVMPLLKWIDASYQQYFKKPLGIGSLPPHLEHASDPTRLAWVHTEAPFMVLAQDTQAEPLFFYSNAAASQQFGYSAEELLQMPARLSAPPDGQEHRAALLRVVEERGSMTGYSGIRVAKGGKLFRIRDSELWLIHDAQKNRRGMGALVWTESAPGRIP